MWRIIYSVSPRTPEGGQAGKEDKPHPLHILRFCGAHTQLSQATSMRGNVASYLFGKPPNPRRGTSWKRRQTSPFTHTPLLRCTYPAVAGYLQRGNVASYLFGKPPNPRRGTSWKRRQTSLFTYTLLLWGTYPAVAGYLQRGNVVTEKGKNDE